MIGSENKLNTQNFDLYNEDETKFDLVFDGIRKSFYKLGVIDFKAIPQTAHGSSYISQNWELTAYGKVQYKTVIRWASARPGIIELPRLPARTIRGIARPSLDILETQAGFRWREPRFTALEPRTIIRRRSARPGWDHCS